MIGELLRYRGRRTPERSSFRPFLETLESREVPTSAQVSAAFHQLPVDVNNLQATLAARPVNIENFNTNLSAVGNDMVTIAIGAPGFVPSDRLRIDSALYTSGLVLIYDGYTNINVLPTPQFLNIVELGQGAVRQGLLDGWVATVFPGSSGTAIMT
jgi:hypothetical protein